MMPFSAYVRDVRDFEIDIEDPATLRDIQDYVSLFQAGGDTAIYSSLQQAYDLALAAQEQDPSRHYSIVLMSDGKNTTGIEKSDFESFHWCVVVSASSGPPHVLGCAWLWSCSACSV